MNTLKKLAYLCITAIVLASCSSDDDAAPIIEVPPLGAYENGVLITNEGPFGTGSGTISFISEDYSTVEQSIFAAVNNSNLGNVVQSMGFAGDLAYIVSNNSHQINVVNRNTFEAIATISTGLDNPRFFVAVGDTGYVSNWGDTGSETDDFIAVIDLLTSTVTATIPVSFGPEKMVVSGAKIYVAHQGAYGQNNLVSVVDTAGNTVESEILVGDVPNSMVLSGSDLWVLCGGKPSYTGAETNGNLIKINTATNAVSETLAFGDTEHPSGLSLDGSNLYYGLNGGVYEMRTSSNTLPQTLIISGSFYGMTTHNGMLFGTDAGDFASDGSLKIFDLATYTETQSFTVGIIPGGIYFNE